MGSERKEVPGWPGVFVTKDGIASMIVNGRVVPIAQRAKGLVTVVFSTKAGPMSRSANVKTLVALAWEIQEEPEEKPVSKKKSKRDIDAVDAEPKDEQS